MKKITLILLSLLCSVSISYAGDVDDYILIKGGVFNEAMEPIQGALLIVRTVDSTLLCQTITNPQGNYQLKIQTASELVIEIRHVGYESYHSKLLLPANNIINFILRENIISLEQVTVSAKYPIIRMQDGNLIVNASLIPNSENMTLDKILNKIPGISTSDGLTLNGQNATLYIDGVRQQIGAKEVMNALSGAIIQDVQLLSMPTAEWGVNTGSIINVKTKKRNWDGYYLTLGTNLSVHRDKELSNSNDIVLVMKKKNITFNSMFAYNTSHSRTTTIDTTWHPNGISIDRTNGLKERLNSLSFLANVNWASKSGHNLNLNTYIYNDYGHITSDRKIGDWESGNYMYNNYTTNTQGHDDLWSAKLEYKSPDLLHTRVTASYAIVYGGQRSDNDYMLEDPVSKSFDKYMSSYLNMTGYMQTVKGLVVQDFGQKKKFSLTTGFNANFGKLNDKTDYRMTSGNSLDNDHSRFTGRENSVDVYIQARYKISDKWSILGYYTAAYTNYDLNLTSENTHTKSNYWKHFPYLTLSFSTKNYKGTIGYTTSMTRPNYEWMLPGVRYADKYSYTVGNPNLVPTTQKRIVWSNLLFGYMTVQLSYAQMSNAMGRIMVEQSGDRTVYSYMNYAKFDDYNIYFSLPYELANGKLSGEVAAGYTYRKLKKNLSGFIAPEGRNYEERLITKLNIDYQVTKSLLLSSYFSYTPPQRTIQTTRDYQMYLGLGLAYTCLKDKLTFTLDFYDILDKRNNNNNCTNYFGNSYQHVYSVNNSQPRTISLSIRLKLNRGEKVATKAKGIESDMSRFGDKDK